MKKIILILLVLQSAAATANDSLITARIASEILVNSNAYENLRFLCKKIGPRLSGSPQAEKAVTETARMLSEAGADTVFLQPCMVPRWIRGKKETGSVLINGKKFQLRLLAIGNSVATGNAGVSGEVVEVKDMSQLHQLGDKVKGKIVFFNIPMNPLHVRTFRAYGESVTGRVHGASQAAKYGAVGVMVRSLASNRDIHPHTGTLVYNDSFPRIPAVAISTEDAEIISAAIKNGGVSKATYRTNCGLMPDVQSYNVIGEIRGTENANEIITVGGHLDSWDVGEGAHDDGAGCVQSIEIIRAFKALGLRPKRTIRAVMFMNEENGGRGAQAYLDEAIRKKEDHLFALESDAGGFTPSGFSLDMKPKQLQKILGWKNLFQPYLATEFFPGGGGADIGPLKVLGTALAGLSPDSQRYFDLHHAESDTFEAVSKRELDLGAVNMALLIWLISENGL